MTNLRRTILAVTPIVIAALLAATTGCTDEANSRRALESQGFQEIVFTGYEFFDCSEDDFYHTGFRAKNAQGRPVEGTVCCGMLVKNCTVRW